MIHLDNKFKLLFLCDRQNHCRHSCYDECKHTTNKEWALHKSRDSWQFELVPPILFIEDEGGYYTILQDIDENGNATGDYTIVFDG